MSAVATVTGAKVLVVDDEESIREVYARALVRQGFEVVVVPDGNAALHVIDAGSFDVIVSDIDMPHMNGVRLLEQIRLTDLDVPVLFVTGRPSMDTAIEAVRLGALSCLMKPVPLGEVVTGASRLHSLAKAKRAALRLMGGPDRFAGDHAGLTASFARALQTLWMAYQPIISWSAQQVFGYEALLRSREPEVPNPGAVLDAAERLGRMPELGRVLRRKAVVPMDRLPADCALFINLDPTDLFDDQLPELVPTTGTAAERIVFEITERASLDRLSGVRDRVALLRRRGFRIALDDLGAGYGGLTSFTQLEPDLVKLDMGLVRGIAHDETRQTVVRTMIGMCTEMNIAVIAEGIETQDDRDELIRLGCDLMQGFLFAKPEEPFVAPTF